MEIFKKSLAMTLISFKRWRYDRRIWLIFAFIGVFLLKEILTFTRYGLDFGGSCTIFILPILFSSPYNAVGSVKLLMHVGMILLLCDAPFMQGNVPYIILRGRRRCWWISSFLYIIGSAFIYLLFITLISTAAVLPIGIISDSWGSVIEEFLYGSLSLSMEEIYQAYHHIRISAAEVQYLYPDATMLYTYFAVWADFSILGLLMYLISLSAKNSLWAICGAAFLVFLDPLLSWLNPTKIKWYWLLSPVSWSSADALDVISKEYILSVPYTLTAYAILITALLIGIAIRSRRVMIEGKV